MKKVAIVNTKGDLKSSLVKEKLLQFLKSKKVEVVDQANVVPDGVAFVISLGGDGTVLKCARMVYGRDIPILALNLGHLGYLAEIESKDAEEVVEQALNDILITERRLMLCAEVYSKGEAAKYVCLNDVVLERADPGKTIKFSSKISGNNFVSYSADGIVISTPTGSTAYNFSIRGAILSPELRAFVMSPISPHITFDRSIVLGETETVQLTLSGTRGAAVVIDGNLISTLKPGDSVLLSKAQHDTLLMRQKATKHFSQVLKEKFQI